MASYPKAMKLETKNIIIQNIIIWKTRVTHKLNITEQDSWQHKAGHFFLAMNKPHICSLDAPLLCFAIHLSTISL